ncbi:unnamed protein product [Mytilus edulis]|uniref:Uncharacterized protein n=1 Tax=Mytilus edulis TaxID=6550 RepID=A0A8S3R811_MYTED|nr:unnamed protein product [Mytilus edulis]
MNTMVHISCSSPASVHHMQVFHERDYTDMNQNQRPVNKNNRRNLPASYGSESQMNGRNTTEIVQTQKFTTPSPLTFTSTSTSSSNNDNKTSGSSRTKWKFFEEMNGLMGDKHTVRPLNVSETAISDDKEEENSTADDTQKMMDQSQTRSLRENTGVRNSLG